MPKYSIETNIELSKPAMKLSPQRLIAIYTLPKMSGSPKQMYLETAAIDNKGRVLSFVPMNTRKARLLAGQLDNRVNDKAEGVKGWVDDRILYLDVAGRTLTVIWKREPGRAEVKYAKELKIPDGPIDCPGIIFAHSRISDTLFVWAYKEFRGRETMLYHLPFHNVYQPGNVCMGSSRTKFLAKDTLQTYLDRREWLFFNTPGSEIHYDKGWKSNINTLHRKLSEEQRPFPVENLIEYKKLSKLSI